MDDLGSLICDISSVLSNPILKASYAQSRALEQEIWTKIWGVLKTLMDNSKNPNSGQKLDNVVYMELHKVVFDFILATELPFEVKTKSDYWKFERKLRAEFLNQKMVSFFKAYLSLHRNRVVQFGAHANDNEVILRRYCNVFQEFFQNCEIIHNICSGNKAEGLGLDTKLLNFLAVGSLSWKNILLEHIQTQVVQSLMDLIDKIRNRKTSKNDEILLGIVSKSMLMIDSFNPEFQLHEKILEPNLLARTSAFYHKEYEMLVNKKDSSVLIKGLADRLLEEEVRARQFIPIMTQKIIASCEKALILDRIDYLIKEFKSFLEVESTNDLKNLFSLLSRTGPERVAIIHQEFYEFVLSQGREAISALDMTKNKSLVNNFIDANLRVLRKYEGVIAGAFMNDSNFSKKLNDALREYFGENKVTKRFNQDLPSNFLALYFDTEIRTFTGFESEVTKLSEKLGPLVKVVKNLDSFIQVYVTRLANRLLMNLDKLIDSEMELIQSIAEMVGKNREIKKCEGMFQDIQYSIDFSGGFTERNKNLGYHLNGIILKSSSWPYTQREDSFIVPEEMAKANDAILNLYGKRHTGRKLHWLHNLSYGEIIWVRPQDKGRKLTFRVSAYQMSILLAFNGKDQMTIEELKVITGMPNIFDQVVHPLEEVKILLPILSAKGGTKVAYRINTAYERKGKSKTINLIKTLRSDEKIAEEKERKILLDSRKFEIQCSLVRILKTNKTVLKRHLIAELGKENLRFSFTVQDVEKELAELRERAFCSRNLNEEEQEEETGDTQYTYIA